MEILRVGVTQLSCGEPLDRQWEALAAHCRSSRPDILVLPELPFSRWFPSGEAVNDDTWHAAIAAHDAWVPRVNELSASVVIYSRPVEHEGRRINQGVLHHTESRRIVPSHGKTVLPDEPGWRERTWFEAADDPVDAHIAVYTHLEVVRIGILLCSELWMDHARRLGTQGARLIAAPRATAGGNHEHWLLAGRMTSIQSAAFGISANRAGLDGEVEFAGRSWIISPEGEVLAETSAEEPFITRELSLIETETARYGYPRTLYMSPDEQRRAFI